ncbi:TRAP transporter small permease [Roseibium aestuarii]|uniref:TRAP transporter small permease protein n=1 Tax=Roseibium aestuarii TaxID=2600299 RepID=A0ABW4JW90_9HYPH|nr:TRAP transporter small permease [Roseibium aestuarii]
MMQDTRPAWWRSYHQATLLLAGFGALCLLFMVIVIAVGVVMRYLFGQPILGSNEIVQLTSLALVMSALPYCTAHDGHVGVDVFDNLLGRWGRLFGDLLSRVLAVGVLGHLVWRAWLKALDAFEFEDATNMLDLPIWPFYAILVAGTALCVLVYLAQIVMLLSGKK